MIGLLFSHYIFNLLTLIYPQAKGGKSVNSGIMNRYNISNRSTTLALSDFKSSSGSGNQGDNRASRGHENKKQLSMTVTDIPKEYNGQFGTILLVKEGKNPSTDAVGFGERTKIDQNNVTFNIIDFDILMKQTKIAPYSQFGSYDIYFDIYPQQKGGSPAFKGYKLKQNISNSETDMRLASFTKNSN